MNVLLPAPGTPVIPRRCERPECGRMRSSTSSARMASADKSLSKTVIARPSITRFPASTPSTYSEAPSRRGLSLSARKAAHKYSEDFLRRDRDRGARAKHAYSARGVEKIVIPRGNNSPNDDENV